MQKTSKISDKLARLDEMIAWFNSDDFSIETAIEHFRETKKLADEIELNLKEVKNEIIVLSEKFDRD